MKVLPWHWQPRLAMAVLRDVAVIGEHHLCKSNNIKYFEGAAAAAAATGKDGCGAAKQLFHIPWKLQLSYFRCHTLWLKSLQTVCCTIFSAIQLSSTLQLACTPTPACAALLCGSSTLYMRAKLLSAPGMSTLKYQPSKNLQKRGCSKSSAAISERNGARAAACGWQLVLGPSGTIVAR